LARLSAETRELAKRSIAGEHYRALHKADFSLNDSGELSNEMRYARAVKLIGLRAPLRVLEGERIIGSATLLEATRHQTPVVPDIMSTSHTTIGFHRVLETGYRGLRDEIRGRLERGDLDADGVDFLKACDICLDGAAAWHRRHIELLEERIADSTGKIRADYMRVLAAAQNVPENPPANFHEAVQSLWFMFEFQRLCGNWSGVGRIDGMLGPYLKTDLEAGRITLDDARELIAHFWIKGNEWASEIREGGSGDAQNYQNIILSGVDEDGNDITNDVTYLVLDVVEELLISDFPIAVRISERTPEKLFRRIAEVQRRGGGIVAVYNEDVVINAICRFGYDIREARGFTNDGCWEIIIPGRTNFGYKPFDMLGLLQDVLRVNSSDEEPPAFADFEDLYAAFHERLVECINLFNMNCDSFVEGGRPAPLISLFVEDCIERARGYHNGGPRYVVCSSHAGGLPDTANALQVIDKLVYVEQSITLAGLVNVLRNNWRDSEALRMKIRKRFAFYGNNDAESAAMIQRLYDDFVTLVGEVPKRNGVLRPAGISTFGRQIAWADGRGATAAGTLEGDFLSNNFSPAPGTEMAGPTAVIKSFCSVDFERLPCGTALDFKINPASIKGEAGIDALCSLMKTFLALGGVFMHIDVVDGRTLRDAQAHPDKYPNLAVRISGWSARFASLNKQWQDMIIARTELKV